MTYADIQKKLLEYNCDPKTQAIREYYNKKSFLEIMSKARSETTHSAFLAWLLKGEGFTSKEDAPLMRFLDVLVKNSNKIDSPVNEASIKTAILSRTLEYTDVRTFPEQTIKDISEIPSRDRLDIYLTASFIKSINDKKHLRIVIENKIFSDEIKADLGGKRKTGMDDLTKVKNLDSTNINIEKYKTLNQTQRYYTAVEEHPKDKKYRDEAITIFVFLTPSNTRPTDEHFIPVSYQDLMDYVLEPLLGDINLDNSTKIYLQEYVNALSVPSISEFDNEMTVLAVSKKESKKLKDFWGDYKDIIKEAANSNKEKSNISSETLVLQKFYEKNQPLFIAIYHILKDEDQDVKNILKPFTTRDYTKYTLKYEGIIIGENLGKRATVLAAAKFIINNRPTYRLELPKEDYGRVFYYKKDEFEELYNDGKISKDVHDNRYSEIEGTEYVVCNQWGIGNWYWVEEVLLQDSGFELISE